ncbi:TPA: hypothetical protein ACGUP3_004313, partial [Vibrio vulnificus]
FCLYRLDCINLAVNHEAKNVWWNNRYWYLPVALVIASGYLFGGYTWYATRFMCLFPSIVNPDGRLFIELYALGIVGGAMHCSIFFAKEVNEKILGNVELPTFLHFIGYALQILGGGITGIFLYLAVKVGLVILIQSSDSVQISYYTAWVLAFSGGFTTHLVKQFIAAFVSGSLKNENGQKVVEKQEKPDSKNHDDEAST